MNEEKVQALVILDNHASQFEPFSSRRAAALHPIASSPKTLLDATLEFLISINRINKIVLLCQQHFDQIEAHLNKTYWNRNVEADIALINVSQCSSLSDVLDNSRKQDPESLTYVLINATAILSNVSLTKCLEKHRSACEFDSDAVVTILCVNKLEDFGPAKSLNRFSCHKSQQLDENFLFKHLPQGY